MPYIFQEQPGKYINSINDSNFEDIALQLFRYQYNTNKPYRDYVNALNIYPENIDNICKIPFLPVSFYKTHTMLSSRAQPGTRVFESSSTTSDATAKHYVPDMLLYDESLLSGFKHFYGRPEQYVILALLPSYLQRQNASLVYMAEKLMGQSGHTESGFYLDELGQLYQTITELEKRKQPTLLIGVTFALLDFAEQYHMKLEHSIIMETGGMKGRRKEMIRAEVHQYLKERLGVKNVHSEYGMTEMLSQAYSSGNGLFKATNSMSVLVRDINDPMDVQITGQGCLNVIDLANVHSCAFIATDDIGKVYADGSFEVQGRVDNSALRGCNLMVI